MGSKIQKIYVVREWAKTPATAKKYFRNRKIKGARIHRMVKDGNSIEIYFTK